MLLRKQPFNPQEMQLFRYWVSLTFVTGIMLIVGMIAILWCYRRQVIMNPFVQRIANICLIELSEYKYQKTRNGRWVEV
jgi:hypothetical protein